MAKTILCYGDSNTWASIASPVETTLPSRRHDAAARWPRTLESTLGEGYTVVEEGLSGRTTMYAEPGAEYKNGEPYLLPCLLSHRPLDLVVLMLGTNDLKLCFHLADDRLGAGLARLVDIVQGCPECGADNVPPKILILSPTHIVRPKGRQDYFNARGGETGMRRVRLFAPAYRAVAAAKGCFFLDAAEVAAPDPADGMHLTRESHITLGQAVAAEVRKILRDT